MRHWDRLRESHTFRHNLLRAHSCAMSEFAHLMRLSVRASTNRHRPTNHTKHNRIHIRSCGVGTAKYRRRIRTFERSLSLVVYTEARRAFTCVNTQTHICGCERTRRSGIRVLLNRERSRNRVQWWISSCRCVCQCIAPKRLGHVAYAAGVVVVVGQSNDIVYGIR